MMLICYAINVCVLAYGGITDYKRREIPNLVPIILLMTGLCATDTILFRFLCMVLTAVILLLASKLSKTSLPGGDFKLICALSFSNGLFVTIVVLFLTGLGAILVSIFQKHSIRRNIPLCTYVAPAYILTFAAQFIFL